MDIRFIVSILLFGILTVGSEASHHWNYLSFGPKDWHEQYPTCNKNHQSPINIEIGNVFPLKRQKILHNYDRHFGGEYTAINNGHALQINFPEDTHYRLKKGRKVYTPLQVHIHFNPFTMKGSEHTVNGKKSFAEVHIVHRRSILSNDTPLKRKDDLLVIGMFVDVAEEYGEHYHGQSTAPALHQFIEVARACPHPNESTKLDAFPLSVLFPYGKQMGEYNYVNYKGSLTTPPCSEVVDWIVIVGKVLKISKSDMKAFKGVHNSNHNKLMGGDGGNNRPIQALNGRRVLGIKKEIF